MLLSISVICTIITTLATLSEARPIEKRSSGPLKLDFQVVRKPTGSLAPPGHGRFGRKAGGIHVELENQFSLYVAEMEIGTPPQKLKIDIDTGSSDLWVPAVSTQSENGVFDSSKSTSYKTFLPGFRTAYGDGSYALGEWGTDHVSLGGATLKDVHFGYATNQTAKQAILGVGFAAGEASAFQENNSFTYDNFPVQLKKQNIINKKAYSLYLNSREADAGSILFGAIDHAKFEGDLTLLDILHLNHAAGPADGPEVLFVALDSISNGNTTLSNKPAPALLDSGSTLINAPAGVAFEFGKQFGTYEPRIGGFLAPCSAKGEDFVFKLGAATIKVPFRDLLFNLKGPEGTEDDKCLVGVLAAPDDYYILGDSFLRSAYVYYDLDDAKIGLAQAKYTDKTDIKVV